MNNLIKFKDLTAKKTPFMYSYLNEHIPHHDLVEELLLNIFARFYKTYEKMPSTLNSDQWLVLIANKYMVDFCNWRITEGADHYLPFTTYQASVLKEEREQLLKEWIGSMGESDRELVETLIIQDEPVKGKTNAVAELVAKKIEEWEVKYGQRKEKK